MKTLKAIISALVIALLLSACSSVKPYAVTDNSLGTKVGKSTNKCMFTSGLAPVSPKYWPAFSSVGLCFNNKSFGIQQAAQNGGISKVGAVDLKITNKIFMKEFTLIVYGE